MNLFDVTLLNAIFIIFPMLIYFFVMAYMKNISNGEKNLMLEFALTFSVYFMLRYTTIVNFSYPLVFINVPLIIAYLNGKKGFALILSVFLIIYSNATFDFPVAILLFEYIIYYIFYLIFCVKYDKRITFINLMVFSKIIINFISLEIYNMIDLNDNKFIIFIIITAVYFVITHISLLLLQSAERILNFHMTFKELENEKQIRNSLFKITHEIKNPIAVCKGYLDMFDPNNKEHSIKYIPIVRDEINHTLIILQDFLALNKTKIEKEILDINILLDDVVGSFESILRNNSINLVYVGDDDEVFVSGDYYRLKQVMINVVKNSMEALDGRENKSIKIYSEISDKNIKISFEDNGCGIDKEALSKLKEPFFTTKKNGTGMGVYLCDEIVRAHNGKLLYDSLENVGTTVRIILPVTEI